MASNPVKQTFDEFNKIKRKLQKEIKELEEEIKEEKNRRAVPEIPTHFELLQHELLRSKRRRIHLYHMLEQIKLLRNITG